MFVMIMMGASLWKVNQNTGDTWRLEGNGWKKINECQPER